jgi:hypothetical protein
MTLRETLAAAAREYLPSPRLSDSSSGISYDSTRASGTTRGQAGRSSAPRAELRRYRRLYETCALVRSPINQMASDTTADGVRFVAESDETQDFLADLVTDIALVGGESRHLIDLVEQLSVAADVGGEAPIELVPAAEDADRIAALRVIPAETLAYQTRPGQAYLLNPGDTQYSNATLTDDGTAAAVVQHKGGTGERALDSDSFVRYVRDPNPGTVRGTSAIEPVADRVDALRKKLENSEEAIASKSAGLWFAGAEPLVLSGPDGDQLVEPDEDVTKGIPEAIQNAGPGDVVTHDSQVSLDSFQGEVADLSDYLTHDVNYILSSFDAVGLIADDLFEFGDLLTKGSHFGCWGHRSPSVFISCASCLCSASSWSRRCLRDWEPSSGALA